MIRKLGAAVWGRKVAALPERGVLLVATDIQGNWHDYARMKALLAAERAAGHDACLAFVGDLVHGPNPSLHEPGQWPHWLGTPYVDRSAEVLVDFERFTREAPAFSLLGNHEHAHIGGPRVAKFHSDEAAVLDAALGDDAPRLHGFMRSFPLVARGACGLVLTHGAPFATEATPDAFERLSYDGYEESSIGSLYAHDTVGALLWARSASDARARALLSVVHGRPEGVVVFGHDVVHAGYEKMSETQLCLSTSFGLFDEDKRYLRVDLGAALRSVDDLRDGVELLHLW